MPLSTRFRNLVEVVICFYFQRVETRHNGTTAPKSTGCSIMRRYCRYYHARVQIPASESIAESSAAAPGTQSRREYFLGARCQFEENSPIPCFIMRDPPRLPRKTNEAC